MTWYTIYNSLSRSDFEQIKSRLNQVEKISSPIMQMNDFYLNRISYDEVLSLDYLSKDYDFRGNIGVTYNEDSSINEQKLFEFYILKSYDTKTHRFYKKVTLEKLFSLEDIEKMFITLIEKCFSIYNSIRKEDLTESIDFKK